MNWINWKTIALYIAVGAGATLSVEVIAWLVTR